MTATIWTTLFGQPDNPDDLKGQPTLSEDACGDLIHSLARLGYLSNIATSLDGKSFITHDQLDTDILSLLDKRSGRVSVLDLPRALNANSSDIQDRIQALIRSRPGRIFHIQDELVKLEYLQEMTSQLNEELAQRGFLTALEVSRKYKFGIDFIRQFLKDRVGSTILGQCDTVDRGLVVAPWFHEQEKAALLKVLHQLKEPTSLASLRAKNVVQEQLMYGLCDTLAKETGLPGTFKGVGDQGIFVPQPYEQQQSDWIETFFKNNGFIELDAVKKRGVADPKAYMQANHPTALLLETHAVKESIWSIIDASVEDTIANLSWIDVKPLVPSPLTKEDISRLLRQLPSLAEPTSRIPVAPEQDPSLTGLNGGSPQEALVIQDSIVVTSGQFQKCLLRMGPLLDRKAKALLSWRLSFGNTNNDDDLAGSGGQGEDVEGVFSNDAASLRSLLDQASAITGGGQGSRKSQKGKQTQQQQQQQGAKSDGKKQLRDFLTIQDIKDEIREMEPDFDSAVVNATAGILYKDLLQNLKDRNRSMVLRAQEEEEEDQEQGGEESQDAVNEEQIQEAQKAVWSNAAMLEIQSLSKRIQLSSKAIEVFDDATVRNSLSKYLLQSLCVELLDLTTLYLTTIIKDSTAILPMTPSKNAEETRDRLQKAYSEHHSQTEAFSTGKGPFLLPSEDATKLLAELIPKDQVDPLKKMRKLTAGSGKEKNLTEYLNVWSGLVNSSNSRLEKVDTSDTDDGAKLSEHLEELHRVLVGIEPQTDSGALMLHIVTLIAFQNWTGRMLHASGKYVPRILRQLRSTIEQQQNQKQLGDANGSQLELLEKMMSHVMSNIKQAQEVSGPESEQDAKQLWQSVHDLGIELTKQ